MRRHQQTARERVERKEIHKDAEENDSNKWDAYCPKGGEKKTKVPVELLPLFPKIWNGKS